MKIKILESNTYGTLTKTLELQISILAFCKLILVPNIFTVKSYYQIIVHLEK